MDLTRAAEIRRVLTSLSSVGETLDVRAIARELVGAAGETLGRRSQPASGTAFNNTRKKPNRSRGRPDVGVPLLDIGPVDKSGETLNVQESYTLSVVRRTGAHRLAEDATLGGTQ